MAFLLFQRDCSIEFRANRLIVETLARLRSPPASRADFGKLIAESGQSEVSLDMWWDEWLEGYRITRIASCPCRD